MSDITAPRFKSEAAARKHLERIRWPEGPVCPHCGVVDNAHRIKGKSARPGLWFCGACRKQFTVTVGTLFERSKIPLHKWLLAVHLLCSSKKGISTHQLHRMLDVTYKTAWFMSHRIREAMRPMPTKRMGGKGKTVEADETYIGGKEKNKHNSKRLSIGGGWGIESPTKGLTVDACAQTIVSADASLNGCGERNPTRTATIRCTFIDSQMDTNLKPASTPTGFGPTSFSL